MLERIATALDLPADLFRAEAGGRVGEGERREAFAEMTELVRLFSRIGDPEARRCCIAFVRAEAQKSG